LGLGWRVRAWAIEPRRTNGCEGRVQVRALLWAGRIRLLWQRSGRSPGGGPRAMLAALRTLLAPLRDAWQRGGVRILEKPASRLPPGGKVPENGDSIARKTLNR